MEHGLSLSDFPEGVIANVMAHVGASSAIDVFKFKTIGKTFAQAGDYDEVYRMLEVDSIFSLRIIHKKLGLLALLREKGNRNMLFRDGVAKLFYVGDEAAGKEMLQQAAKLGHSDAILVLGLLLMAEAGDRIAEASRLLNDEYTKAASLRDVVRSYTKVRSMLWDRERLIQRKFPVCGLGNCPHHHPSRHGLVDAWLHRREWLLRCNVCLWDACYLRFADIWE